MIEIRERLALRNKVKLKFRDQAGIKGRDRNENVIARPNGLRENAKTKLRFRVHDLNLPERRKRYTSRREEEEVDEQMFPCGKATQSRTHIVGGCEMHKEERDVIEHEMKEIDGCDMEELVPRVSLLSFLQQVLYYSSSPTPSCVLVFLYPVIQRNLIS